MLVTTWFHFLGLSGAPTAKVQYLPKHISIPWGRRWFSESQERANHVSELQMCSFHFLFCRDALLCQQYFFITFQNVVSFTISSSTSFPRIPFAAVLGCSTPCLPSYWAVPSTCTMRTGVDTLSAWLHLLLIHEAFLHYCWSKKELFKANVEIGRKGKDVYHKLVDLLLPETLFQRSIILTLLYQYKSSI